MVAKAGRTENQLLPMRVHIRWMLRRDMNEILRIEQDSFELPWTEEDFLNCLRSRNCIGMSAEQGERVVAFMIYELHKRKLDILNFAVQPDFRRARVGAQMVSKLISKLSGHRRTHITAVVRETNLQAQLFFRAVNFTALRVLRDHFDDTGESAYLMRYRLPMSEWARENLEEEEAGEPADE